MQQLTALYLENGLLHSLIDFSLVVDVTVCTDTGNSDVQVFTVPCSLQVFTVLCSFQVLAEEIKAMHGLQLTTKVPEKIDGS